MIDFNSETDFVTNVHHVILNTRFNVLLHPEYVSVSSGLFGGHVANDEAIRPGKVIVSRLNIPCIIYCNGITEISLMVNPNLKINTL